MNVQSEKDNLMENQKDVIGNGQFQACIGSPNENENACQRHQKDYLIEEEEEALSKLRQIKQQATSYKKRLNDLKKIIDYDLLKKEKERLSPEEKLRWAEQEKLYAELNNYSDRLEKLRSQWKIWDDKRKKATKVKMIRLGHTS